MAGRPWNTTVRSFACAVARPETVVTRKAIDVILEDSKEPVFERLRREGVSAEEIEALVSSPQISEEIWRTATRRYLLPIIPALIRDLAKKAEKGVFEAQKMVIDLLGEKSPLRGQMGLDLGSIDDAALSRLAGQLSAQLKEISSDWVGGND